MHAVDEKPPRARASSREPSCIIIRWNSNAYLDLESEQKRSVSIGCNIARAVTSDRSISELSLLDEKARRTPGEDQLESQG
jgi:hypothetical protein